ncbi:unnamed protein product, partial [Heterotrigona itama]
MIETTQFYILTTHTHMQKIRRARYANTLSVAEIIYKITSYGHHAQCLSPTQVAPGHVSEILTMNTERVKPENPEPKR